MVMLTSRFVTSMSEAGELDVVVRDSYGCIVRPSSSSTSPSFASSTIVRDSILLLMEVSFLSNSGIGLETPSVPYQIQKKSNSVKLEICDGCNRTVAKLR